MSERTYYLVCYILILICYILLFAIIKGLNT